MGNIYDLWRRTLVLIIITTKGLSGRAQMGNIYDLWRRTLVLIIITVKGQAVWPKWETSMTYGGEP
jgi:hypothetical protein